MNQDRNTYRKHIRLPEYDYRHPGAYFITICTRAMDSLFGRVNGHDVDLNAYGVIVRNEWLHTQCVRDDVRLDAFVVMPNHFHGILMIDEKDAERDTSGRREATHRVAATMARRSGPRGPKRNSVGAIIGQFKSQSTRRINKLRGVQGISVWQPNYYEHIIRSDRSLERVREYIDGNPGKWAEDRYYVDVAVRV